MPAPLPATPEEQKQMVDALLACFSWPVEEEYMRDSFEVVTDHFRKKHTVLWPRQSSHLEPSFGRYLHEMGHALLAEQIHPQFSRPYFTKGVDPTLKNTYLPLFDASLDWFVQARLMELTPGPQGDDIDARFKQTAHMLRQGGALPSVEFVVDSGMALASFRKYRGLEIEVQGKLADVVEAFFRTAPEKPTLFGLHGLVRRLMAIFEMHSANLACELGFERWRIDPVKRG
ncbi:MAG: hypothetical protein HY795_10760 [Desulfovibrio sp.]|nr:hypothetical protein [Desulfovibrio sp.]MBI4959782.1 hypothetical protein [Desulfovibrio sp.]